MSEKAIQLNNEQQYLVENNLDVVKLSIHRNIIVNENIFGYGSAKRQLPIKKKKGLNFQPMLLRSFRTDCVHTAELCVTNKKGNVLSRCIIVKTIISLLWNNFHLMIRWMI